jgi:hypothetical protein
MRLKLMRRGEEWLSAHPDRELIVNRYLKRQRSLTEVALARLAEEDQLDPDADEARHSQEEERVEERIGLNRQRLATVLLTLKELGARRGDDYESLARNIGIAGHAISDAPSSAQSDVGAGQADQRPEHL